MLFICVVRTICFTARVTSAS